MICVKGKKKKNFLQANMCVAPSRFLPVCIYHTHRIMHACVRACVLIHTRTRPITYLRAFASPTEHRECGDYATRVATVCNRPSLVLKIARSSILPKKSSKIYSIPRFFFARAI